MKTSAVPETASRYRLWSLLALFALALMDGALAAMWYQAIVQPDGVAWFEILLIVLAVLLGSQVLAALTARLNWSLLARQAIFLGWLIGMLLLSMKLLLFAHTPVTLLELVTWPVRFITLAEAGQGSFIHLVFVLLLMGRGVALAHGPYTPRNVIINFQMGLLALLLYGMFYAPRYPAAASLGLYLYLFGGLIALSATRILSLTDLRAGRMPQFNLPWIASTFGSALLVVGIALLLGWASSGHLVALVIRVMAFIFTVLAALLTLLLDPVVRVLWKILPNLMAPFKALFTLFSGMRLPRFLEEIAINFNEVISQVVPAIIAGRKLFLFAFLIVIVLTVLLGLRFITRLRPAEQTEETADLERTSLKDLLRRFGLGARGGARGRRYSASQMFAAARIRQIYSQLMALSQQLGAARPAAATPLEFLPQLKTLFSEEADSVQSITQAYVKIRYGEYPENKREVDEVVAAWERVKKHGRALARHKSH